MREVSNSDLQTSVPSLDGALVLDAILERKDSNILSVQFSHAHGMFQGQPACILIER